MSTEHLEMLVGKGMLWIIIGLFVTLTPLFLIILYICLNEDEKKGDEAS